MKLVKEIASSKSPAWVLYKVIVLASLASALALQTFGQTPKSVASGLSGTVVDANGAVIPGAVVRLKGSGLESTTGTQGDFRFVAVAVKSAKVEVAAHGFEAGEFEISTSAPNVIVLMSKALTETVMVSTASLAGTPEALESTAGSFERISREELQSARVFDFGEALRKISGVVVRDEEGFGLRPNISIRGTNPTRSSKVLLLEDGMPLAYAPYGDNATYYHPPVERFDSIEVLKGSGQIEYGPVTVAGVVNYITPNPSEKPSVSLRITGGNRDFVNGNAMFSGQMRGVGLVLNLSRKQGEGSRDNTRTGLTDFSSKLVREIASGHVLSVKASVLSEGSQVTYSGLTESEFSAAPRSNPFLNDRFYGNRKGFSMTYAGVLSSRVSLTSNSYVNSFSRDWWRQSSNSSQRPNRLNVDPDCRSMADLHTTCGNEGRLRDYLNAGIDSVATVSYSLSRSRGEFKAGGRLHFESQDRLQMNGDLPTSRTGSIVENNLRDNFATSGFIQNRLIVGDLAVTAGARFEKIGYRRINRLNGASARTDVTQFVPGLGVTYNLGSKLTLFTGMHRGFAPPRTEDIVSNSGGVVELASELSWNYEAGLRSQLHRAISADFAFFRNAFQNQIVPASVAGGAGAVFTNGGRTLQSGFEVSGRFDSAKVFESDRNFFFRFAFTELTSAEFKGRRFSSIPGFASVSVDGNRLPYAPRTTLNVVAGYSRGPLEVFVENNAVSRQFTDDLNTVGPVSSGQRGVIPGQTYWNATANYRVETLKTTFFVTVKNVFDRTFIVDRSRGVLPSSPRLVHVGASVRF